jgi:hypothetical protein
MTEVGAKGFPQAIQAKGVSLFNARDRLRVS